MAVIRRTVYIETSFVSACVTNRTDPKSIYRRDTSVEWWQAKRLKFQISISGEVHLELSSPDYPLAAAALNWIKDIPQLPITDDVLGLAEKLIDEKVMPRILGGDAIHVAVAAFHRVNYIVSWNVRHLANPNKKEHLRKVLARLGMMAPEIVTPELLWED